jgi:tetratricopeptide (TPR) repeat protein
MLGKPIDHRSDIFAFGAVAYELLAYDKAFPGTIQDGLLQRLPNEPPRPLSELCPGLPAGLEAAVMRALAKQPQERFDDLEQARAALRQIRRQLDPDLDLEPLTPPRRPAGAAGTPTPGSVSERGEFVERRARQLAYHRDAARAAFAAQDLDAAAAACEDALMLDPHDEEAMQLLADVQQAKEQHGLASKERRERDRKVRRFLADADLKLSKGDVTAAADLVRHALTLDARSSAALSLMSRIEQAATSAAVALPTLVSTKPKTHPSQAAGGPASAAPNEGAMPQAAQPAQATQATQSSWTTPRIAIAGAAAVLILGAVLWVTSLGDRPAPEETGVRVQPNPVPSATAPATPPVAAPSTPPASETPVAAIDGPRALEERLTRIDATYKRGDLEVSLAELKSLLSVSDDDRARRLARTVAVDARRAMTAAAAAARKQKAADLSPGVFATAERARGLSEQAFARDEFVEAGTQALLATANYAHAEREAMTAAKVAASAAAAQPPETEIAKPVATPPPAPAAAGGGAVSTPAPVIPSPAPAPPPVAAGPAPAAAPSSAATAPPAAASAIEIERAGLVRAMNRLQDAYRERNMKALKAVYPTLPREAEQSLNRSFDKDCRVYDFSYVNPRFALTDDPTSATVTALTTYTCQPRSRQADQVISGQEVFMMRKAGDVWLVERAFMDPRAR